MLLFFKHSFEGFISQLIFRKLLLKFLSFFVFLFPKAEKSPLVGRDAEDGAEPILFPFNHSRAAFHITG